LQRWACIYIRQSSLKQVTHHRESQINQYQLVQHAKNLGWSRERIRIIDADQGLSGKSSTHRQGFKDLVAEVSLGHVGIIFGYEVSRLARNNSDWYHLLDLGAVFGTLIADSDGLYDPRLYNDRLLLGLKGTMSEAELHLLRQRLAAGRLSKVSRGEYRQLLPTGLVRLPDGTVVKEPDDQVRHTIELVFTLFAQQGSCPKVARALCQQDILLPRQQRGGLHKGELLWKRPTGDAVYEMVRNPAYAGAFAYGRRQGDPARQIPGRPATGQVHKPMEEWLHLQQEVYPAYIRWEQYLANQQRLHQNAVDYARQGEPAQGAAREGAALLQGLVTCGCCGYRMRIAYKRSFRYQCDALVKHFGAPHVCMSLHGSSIDEEVVTAFFEAIQPAHLDALETILATQQTEHQRRVQLWQERRQRAQYEAQRAHRQYQVVDPENRLVAAELERRWEETLRALQETEEAYQRFQQTPTPSQIPTSLRDQLQHLSQTLPDLWPGLSRSHQKELLRSLITRVILKREAADRVEVRIVWVSGHYSVRYARPPIYRQHEVTGYADMVQRIQALWEQGLDDEQMATQLTNEGFRSARTLDVSPITVGKIRRKQGWPLMLEQSRNALQLQGQWTPRGLAAHLGVERTWVYRRLSNGTIPSQYVTRHPQAGVYLIQDDSELIDQLRRLLPENLMT